MDPRDATIFQDMLLALGENVDKILLESNNSDRFKACKELTMKLKKRSMSEILEEANDIERAIALMLINLTFEELRYHCGKVSALPLESFRSIPKIRQYTKGILRHGVSEDIRGRILVLGNTGEGKSSLA